MKFIDVLDYTEELGWWFTSWSYDTSGTYKSYPMKTLCFPQNSSNVIFWFIEVTHDLYSSCIAQTLSFVDSPLGGFYDISNALTNLFKIEGFYELPVSVP